MSDARKAAALVARGIFESWQTRVADLDALIERIESREYVDQTEFKDALDRGLFTPVFLTDETLGDIAHDAYMGSLSCVMQVLEKLIPGWDWGRDYDGAMWIRSPSGEVMEGSAEEDCARELLILALNAYRNMEAEG